LRYYFIFLLLWQFSLISPLQVNGQRVQRSLPVQADTIPLTKPDSIALKPKGAIETTIKYSASDSMLFEVDREVVHLYGNATIDYGTMSLKAAYIVIDYDANTLTATTITDSAGNVTGIPKFADGSEAYEAKRIVYNFKTKRGRISEVVTQQGEGFIHAEVVKRNENNEFFAQNAIYTTCNLEHPHFYINTNKLKAIPNDKILSGPFNLVIGDIPTPLGFLFGLFPTPRANRSSGIIVPSFGESAQQGFFLQDGGYYFAWNDYIGTRLTGDIYSLGGYNITADNSYRKRYAYQGNFNLQYRYFKNDEADVEASRSTDARAAVLPPSQRTIWVSWSHNPVPKPGQGRFSASVNAGSSIHQRINYNSQQQYLSPSFQSNITYQKNIPNSPFSYTVKLSQQQSNSAALTNGPGVMNFTLPDINLSMTPVGIYEFLSGNTPTGQWYENFTFGYSTNISNRVSNIIPASGRISGIPVRGEFRRADTLAIDFDNLNSIWENRRSSATHNFSLGLGSFKVLRFFNLSPSVSYREAWLDRKFTYRYDREQNEVDVDTARFGRVYEYNAGASLSTNIYGTVYIKGKRIEAVRHLIRPSISYSYRPDFGRESFGFYQRIQTGADTIPGFPPRVDPRFALLSRFESEVPGQGLSSAVSFGLQNNIEMKVRSRNDTTSTSTTKFEKVSIIDNLGINGSYNFAADSLKLSTIRLNMNTRLFKLIDLNFTSTFDPYQTNRSGQRIDKYVFDGKSLKLARLTDAGVNLRANFSPDMFASSATVPNNNRAELDRRLNPFEPVYVDFKIPWTLSLDYTFYYTKAFTADQADQLRQNIGLNGSLNLTDKWKVGYSASYDVTDQNISNARLDIHRDLHCWDMSISWIPFGFARGYNVTINARSALLRDLRLTKRSSSSGLNFR
jgi:lipopolysaccharide export system protein LptA